jgi:diguanylate cyclase (GGDEF)-like protein
VRNGLQSYTVSSIQEDQEGYIWLATYNGLARINPDTKEITLVNVEQGLIGSIYNRNAAMLEPSGKLYFGSTEGITVFKPEDLNTKKSLHPIFINHFKIFNKDVLIDAQDSPLTQAISMTRAIKLNHEDKMFSFGFVMLNYRNADMNTYAYKLDGFDQDWNYLGKLNTATYTNLDPGTYKFYVKAKTADGEWITSEQSIHIHIAPPIWRTWWAYCLYILLASATAYGIYAIKSLRNRSNTYLELSLTDTLAGAYNRAGIAKVVQRLYSIKDTKTRVCVMLLDIDHFKRVNDERGHNVGDHVIRELVRLTKASIRKEDCFGRWGGEEFILLCPQASPEGAKTLAEKIRFAIASHEFGVEQSLRVTISIGIAFARQEENFEETVERADKALYQAKIAGRNRAVVVKDTE